MFFLNNRTPQVKFFGIKSVKSADAERLLLSLKESFEWIGILNFGNQLHGLNTDGASVNTQWSWYKNLQWTFTLSIADTLFQPSIRTGY